MVKEPDQSFETGLLLFHPHVFLKTGKKFTNSHKMQIPNISRKTVRSGNTA